MKILSFNDILKKIRELDLFKKCFCMSFALHFIVAGIYFTINIMPSLLSGSEDVIVASSISFKDTEVDFIEIPESVVLGGDTNPAPVEKEEWVEGTGDSDKPDAENTDVNINTLSGDGTDADGYMFADLADHPPVPIIDFDLDDFFPKAARSANITKSKVVVEVQVNENGSTAKLKVLSADAGYGFDDAAAKVASRMRFRPGKISGKAVKMLVRMPIVFTLEN